MLDELKNIKTTKQNLKQFGLLFGAISLFVGIYLLFIQDKQAYPYFLVTGVLLFIITFTIPTILKPFYFLWMVFAAILGWVMSRLILSILYYLVFTPIGLIGRIFGFRFIEIKWDEDSESYWNSRSDHIKNDHINQF